MTWLIGCPKSGGALINHPTDWIQSSASPAQWWTGKDTVQVLTRMHSHHRRQLYCRIQQTIKWRDICGQRRKLLFLCHSQCQAANHRMTGDTILPPFNYKVVETEREKQRETNDRECVWRRIDGHMCHSHPDREGTKMIQVFAWVGGLHKHVESDTQLHVCTHTHISKISKNHKIINSRSNSTVLSNFLLFLSMEFPNSSVKLKLPRLDSGCILIDALCVFSLCSFSLFISTFANFFFFLLSFSVFEQGGVNRVTAAELTEQKIGLMLLEVCHKAGGSDYLRQIYHIIQGNEVGKHSLSPAIRWLLAWGCRLFGAWGGRGDGAVMCAACLLWSCVIKWPQECWSAVISYVLLSPHLDEGEQHAITTLRRQAEWERASCLKLF